MNDDALLRYSRQIMLPEIDVAGQEAMLGASAAIIGLGGLGSPVAFYLAACGFGSLTLVDHDVVDASNLQRQIVHTEDAIDSAKVASAAERIARLNPETNVHTIPRKLDDDELRQLASEVDVVLDATDNFQVRYAINDACVAARTPLVSGAAIRMEGQVAVFDPRAEDAPCYRCLYRDGSDEALNCAENGVAAPVVGIIGCIQAMEAMKLVTNAGESLAGYVLYLDALRMEWRKLRLPKDPTCPTCGSESAP
ncbi:MAG: molybdopterin-synthase adenylyltransferase MoeB [Gammaproteobacteria bacterium]|nr:molybdopterin-synthase adenylyltransferase MoeB [Gammaproteobacteria bacterium]